MKRLILLVCAVCAMCATAWAAEKDNAVFRVGKYEIHTLSEGQSSGNASILIGADENMIKTYIPGGTFPMAVNAYLIRGGDKPILVDTGYGRELFKHLDALGVKPEDIGTVLLTHMHGDHIGGLLRDGKVAFPNAQILVSEEEIAYWMSMDLDKVPADKRGGFLAVRDVEKAYKGKMRVFSPDELENPGPADITPGVKAAAAYGHTPGHTVYIVHAGDESLMIWGDIAHAMAIQMPVPTVAVTYDVIPEMAVESREMVLRHVADKKMPIAGMHVPGSGMGTVASGKDKGYMFTPMP